MKLLENTSWQFNVFGYLRNDFLIYRFTKSETPRSIMDLKVNVDRQKTS